MPEQFLSPMDLNDPKTEQEFEALFDYATIGIVVTDKSGNITNFNQYAETQFQFSKKEVIGKPVEILIPDSFRNVHHSHRQEFYADPKPRRMGEGRDLFGMKKDHSLFPVEISLSYYSVKDQAYVIAFIIDITVRKKSEEIVLKQKEELIKINNEVKNLNAHLEQKTEDRTKMLKETLVELEKSKEELSEALEKERELGEMKSRFVTMASHEFRTPLSTILSSAFLLQKYKSESEQEKREKHILRIKNAVADMKSILEDFLSLGKLEEGLQKAFIETMDASVIFGEILEVIREMEPMLKPQQRIDFHHQGDTPIRTDRHLLKNILVNLVSNAIKFSRDNSVISISCNITEYYLTLSVKDNGIGIPEKDQYHLFERFFRAGNVANIQGTGLGLHIVSKYLELLQGNIEVESEVGIGTMLIVQLPQRFLKKQ